MNLLMGYADQWSVAPGDEIKIMVSCRGATTYRADVVRLSGPRIGPAGPVFNEEVVELRTNGEYPGREQPIPVGSYVVVEDKNSLIGGLESFTVQAFIWPTLPGDGYQALLGTWSEETGTGFSIGISPRGCLELCLGRGNNDNTILVTDTVLQTRHWYLVAASYDHITGVASLYQLPYAGHRFHAQKSVRQSGEGIGFAPGPDWFLMGAQHQASARRGAAWRDIVANAHYNGKIECPRLCARVLSEEEIVALAQVTTATALDGQVVAAWDFGQDMSGDLRARHRSQCTQR